jgi:hypothetical protein
MSWYFWNLEKSDRLSTVTICVNSSSSYFVYWFNFPFPNVCFQFCFQKQVQGQSHFLDGFHIQLRNMNDSGSEFKTFPQPDQFVGQSENFVYGNDVPIGNLDKFSQYQFFLVPFFDTFRGRPSNTITAQTGEDGEFHFLYFIHKIVACYVIRPIIFDYKLPELLV